MRTTARPTALGLKGASFYVLLTLAFLAAPYTNLFFLLLAFLSVLAVLGFWWSFQNLRRVSAEVLTIEPGPANGGHDLSLRISTARAAFRVAVWLRVDGHWHEAVDLAVVRGVQQLRGRLPGLSRGLHPVEAAELRSRYPFGILSWRLSIVAPPQVVAFPAPLEVPAFADRGAVVEALCGRQAVMSGQVSPAGLRPFREGDTLRSVHWKASARRNDLIVLEREGDGVDGWEVVLDRRAGNDEFERSLSLMTALALLARDQKETFTIASQGHRSTYGSSHPPIAECLTWLAAAKRMPPEAPPPPASSPAVLCLPRDLRGANGDQRREAADG